jgi:hypothetical protein
MRFQVVMAAVINITVVRDVAPCDDKLTDVSEVFTAFYTALIAVITEAASASETSVNLYQTSRRNKAEDSHLHPRL